MTTKIRQGDIKGFSSFIGRGRDVVFNSTMKINTCTEYRLPRYPGTFWCFGQTKLFIFLIYNVCRL